MTILERFSAAARRGHTNTRQFRRFQANSTSPTRHSDFSWSWNAAIPTDSAHGRWPAQCAHTDTVTMHDGQGPGVLSLCTICPLQSGRLCDPLAWRIAVAGGPESDEVTGRIGANRENAGTLPTTEAA